MAKKKLNKASKAYKRRKRRRILFGIELLVLLVLLSALFVYAKLNQKLDKIESKPLNMDKVEINESVVENEKLTGYMNIALFGLDSRDGNLEKGNSDTVIIASINNDTKEVRLVSLYRDTYLNVGDDTYTKCNAAYAYGGPEQAISMMNTNMDLDITQYVSVNFDALIEVIDMLGGLEIEVDDQEYVHLNNYCVELKEITGKDYEKLPGPGTYNMTGIQATAYARIRYTAGNDFARTERQREVIGKIVDKAKKTNVATLMKIMDKVFPMIATSLEKNEIIDMGMSMLSYQITETAGFPFEHKEKKIKKQDTVVPDNLETNVVQLHQFLFADEAYTPSDTVHKRSKYIIDATGIGKDKTVAGGEDAGSEE
jgi:LCP family protein required for cell wall assembly